MNPLLLSPHKHQIISRTLTDESRDVSHPFSQKNHVPFRVKTSAVKVLLLHWKKKLVALCLKAAVLHFACQIIKITPSLWFSLLPRRANGNKRGALWLQAIWSDDENGNSKVTQPLFLTFFYLTTLFGNDIRKSFAWLAIRTGLLIAKKQDGGLILCS